MNNNIDIIYNHELFVYVSKFISDTYTSNICHNIVYKPYKLEVCGHLYCMYENYYTYNRQQCPTCNTQLTTEPKQLAYNQHVIETIYSSKVKCLNKGCNTTYTIGTNNRNMIQHIDQCEYQYVLCDNKCDKQIMKGDLQHHIETKCSKRNVLCNKCKQHMTADMLISHIDNQLQCSTLQYCINECTDCNDSITVVNKIVDSNHYTNVCVNRRVQCDGCNTTYIYSKMLEHCNTTQHHNNVIKLLAIKIETIKSLERSNTKLKDKLRETNNNIIELSKDVTHLRCGNNVLKRKLPAEFQTC